MSKKWFLVFAALFFVADVTACIWLVSNHSNLKDPNQGVLAYAVISGAATLTLACLYLGMRKK